MTQPAAVLLTNVRAFTADPENPQAEAVAVAGDRIVFAGSRLDAEAWRGPSTRVIDGQGGSLLPGFIDGHFHLLWGSLELADAQLGGVAAYEEVVSSMRAFAGENPNREWLVGRGLQYAVTPPGHSLSRHDLDQLVSDRPLIIFAFDTHTAWANTAALERAGILSGGQTGPNSEIIMGEDGLATGELREPGAYQHVMRLIPTPDDAGKRALLHKGLRLAASMGVTSLHNMNGSPEEMALYAALDDLGELTLRVYVPYSATPETPVEALTDAVTLREMYQSDMVRGGAVKFFMDGVIESYTALMLDEYADLPGNLGGANFSAEHFNRMAIEADRLGLQIFVHAIGDGAVRRTLDGYEAALTANGRRDSRHRVEHIELIHPDDIPRFAALGVIASMQPLHSPLVYSPADVWLRHVGEHRWERGFPWRGLRQAGARLIFGSDWPVVTQNPMLGLYAALNRQPWAAGQPDHRQTLEEAILSYTRDAAYAEFRESRKGQIKSGFLADLVLLPVDIFSIPPEEIGAVKPVLTLCGGRIVYEG